MYAKNNLKNTKDYVDTEHSRGYSIDMSSVIPDCKKKEGEVMLTIKQIRVGADLTLKSASELCGCSVPTFQKWEEEPRKMEFGAFCDLVNYYNDKNPNRQIRYKDVEL